MASKTNELPQFKGYIDLPLNEADFKVLDDTHLSGEEIIVQLAAIVNKGYRLALSYDVETRRAKCTLMDVWPTRTSAGWMLSAESDTVVEALTVLLYKHSAKMGNDWVPFCNQARQIAKYR